MGEECNRRCFLVRGMGVTAGLALGGLGLIGCNNQSGKRADKKMSTEMIAYCGLNCVACPIYLATRETNIEEQKQKRKEIARRIEEIYGMQCRAEDVTDCDGCPTLGGRLFSGCQKCHIRKCASEKGLENCAYCRQYPCEELSKFFDSEGEQVGAKKRLDAIKAQL